MHHSDETQTIIITAGGTGGHVFPAFAIAEYLYLKKYRIIIVTDDRGNRFLPEISERCIYEKHLIGVANVRSGSLWGRIKAGFALLGSVRQMKKFICENKVKAVIGFGGYPAFPA